MHQWGIFNHVQATGCFSAQPGFADPFDTFEPAPVDTVSSNPNIPVSWTDVMIAWSTFALFVVTAVLALGVIFLWLEWRRDRHERERRQAEQVRVVVTRDQIKQSVTSVTIKLENGGNEAVFEVVVFARLVDPPRISDNPIRRSLRLPPLVDRSTVNLSFAAVLYGGESVELAEDVPMYFDEEWTVSAYFTDSNKRRWIKGIDNVLTTTKLTHEQVLAMKAE